MSTGTIVQVQLANAIIRRSRIDMTKRYAKFISDLTLVDPGCKPKTMMRHETSEERLARQTVYKDVSAIYEYAKEMVADVFAPSGIPEMIATALDNLKRQMRAYYKLRPVFPVDVDPRDLDTIADGYRAEDLKHRDTQRRLHVNAYDPSVHPHIREKMVAVDEALAALETAVAGDAVAEPDEPTDKALPVSTVPGRLDRIVMRVDEGLSDLVNFAWTPNRKKPGTITRFWRDGMDLRDTARLLADSALAQIFNRPGQPSQAKLDAKDEIEGLLATALKALQTYEFKSLV